MAPTPEVWALSWAAELYKHTVARDVGAHMGCILAKGWTAHLQRTMATAVTFDTDRRASALAVARLGGSDALRLLVEQWVREDGTYDE